MDYPIEEIEEPPVHGFSVRATVPLSELHVFFGAAFAEMEACARKTRAFPAGPPFARYHSVTQEAVDVEAVMPFAGQLVPGGRVQVVDLPATPAIRLVHVGPYDAMGPAYQAVDRWLEEHHRARGDAPREVYVTDPASVPDPAQWRTWVVQPLAA